MKANNLRRKFTIWYVKKGYSFGYNMKSGVPRGWFKCPVWVKPLLILFSLSVYRYQLGMMLVDGFLKGLSCTERLEVQHGHEKNC